MRGEKGCTFMVGPGRHFALLRRWVGVPSVSPLSSANLASWCKSCSTTILPVAVRNCLKWSHDTFETHDLFNVSSVWQWHVLRSEVLSGMSAKLRTVAASNNRDYPTRSLSSSPSGSTVNCSPGSQALLEVIHQDHSDEITLITCSRHVYMGVVLRAHPVRDESNIQRNTNWEVATLSRTMPLPGNLRANTCRNFKNSQVWH